jgi:transcriptional regulator with XRE-family HTH domain
LTLSKKEKILTLLGKHIRDLRIEKGITQTELANSINKDQPSIHRLERGGVNPSYFYLYEIAEGLDISVIELINFKEKE